MRLSSVLVVGFAANAMAALLPHLINDHIQDQKLKKKIEEAKKRNDPKNWSTRETVYKFPVDVNPADYDGDDAAAAAAADTAVKYIMEKYPELFDQDKTWPSGKDEGRDFPFNLEPGERISQHEEIPLGNGQVAKVWQTKFDDTVRDGPKREPKEHHTVHSPKLPKPKGHDVPFKLEPGEHISQHEEIPLGNGQVAKVWQTKFDDTVREGPKREPKEHHIFHSAKLPRPKDGPKKNVSGREGLPGVTLQEK